MSEWRGAEPHARVDARQLESALLALRHRIVDAPLLLEAPGVTEARAERGKLLTQIDDYLLPRIRQSSAPVLVALVGSTGAGKSTLVNSIVGAQVSQTGIRRPTTNSPVLACHPDEIDWFAENVFLPTLPRVRQQGLAMPGRDGLLVLAGSEGIPRGVALLDTPDIDSVVQAHHEFARQFLDASDLWLFMTTGSRYADAPVWELLRYAKERDAALGIVLARVQPRSRDELTRHFTAMLEKSGLGGADRFLIPETVITEGMLPAAVYAPIRDWLTGRGRARGPPGRRAHPDHVRRARYVPHPGPRARLPRGRAAGPPGPAAAVDRGVLRRSPRRGSTRRRGTGRCSAARRWPGGRISPAPAICCAACRHAAAAAPWAARASSRSRPARRP